MPQPRGEGRRIEAHRAADLERGNAVLRGELVDLALRNIQKLRNVGDSEGARSPVERIREVHGCVTPHLSPEQGDGPLATGG